jgi:hypothetical protein
VIVGGDWISQGAMPWACARLRNESKGAGVKKARGARDISVIMPGINQREFTYAIPLGAPALVGLFDSVFEASGTQRSVPLETIKTRDIINIG